MRQLPKRKKNRLKNYDYSRSGSYFVTICSKDMLYYFGGIKNGKVILNQFGGIAQNCWLNIENHFSRSILDEFIIMPNHVHGIIGIKGEARYSFRSDRFDRSKMELSKIIQGFKAAVSRNIHKNFPDVNFAWHRSFYDHIIRNDRELFLIRQYIRNNPKQWIIKN